DACLYVEMSGTYIDETYPEARQKLIVESLVNTLGHYYDATYVVMTIEGQAYPVKNIIGDAKGRIKVEY
ncbi:MAG: hypothetical protein RR531_13635, partial [Longicatena sp.]